jgi:hypothetical protein
MNVGIVADSLALTTEVCESMGRLMRRSAPVDDTRSEEGAPRRTGPGGAAPGGR